MKECLAIIGMESCVTEKTGWGAYLDKRGFRRVPESFSMIAQTPPVSGREKLCISSGSIGAPQTPSRRR
jgi:hypothetical protein